MLVCNHIKSVHLNRGVICRSHSVSNIGFLQGIMCIYSISVWGPSQRVTAGEYANMKDVFKLTENKAVNSSRNILCTFFKKMLIALNDGLFSKSKVMFYTYVFVKMTVSQQPVLMKNYTCMYLKCHFLMSEYFIFL